MLQKYYTNQLYPLQDKVLQAVQEVNHSFYLSGGTALSRFYLHHRYSDDLDFFVNQYPDFQSEVGKIITHLKSKLFSIEIANSDSSFIRLFIIENELSLKLEWINDVAYTFGQKLNESLFHRVDHWQNILSNKLSALSRNEAKDLADILFISKKYSFSWPEIIAQAKEKDLWVEEIEISRLIFQSEVESLQKVNWIISPDLNYLEKLKNKIALDILEGNHNISGN